MDKSIAIEILKHNSVLDTKPRTARNIIINLAAQGDIDLSEPDVVIDFVASIDELNLRILSSEVVYENGRDRLYQLAHEGLITIETLLLYDKQEFGFAQEIEDMERISTLTDNLVNKLDYVMTWQELISLLADRCIDSARMDRFLGLYRNSLRRHYFNNIPQRDELNHGEIMNEMVGHLVSGRLEPEAVSQILKALI
jgi:hypothetical protein